ncbi:MAG: tetratricopeptide repeat protein [Bacteroidetes bacterium]|nr:tetratricopeptide repeat protein [Bacteroidota bacterium]
MGKRNKKRKIADVGSGEDLQTKPKADDFLNPGNSESRSSNILILTLCAIIAVCTFLVYSPLLKNEFTNWDDPVYVTENNLIKSVSWTNIKNIFNTQNKILDVYNPLTILSYAIEYHFYELDPKPFFRDNLLIHVFNTVLVFLLIYLLCNSLIIAVFTALAFGIHPMHVESVAWITERKDVLFSFFFLLGLIFYRYYVIRNNLRFLFYMLTLLMFILSVLAKPQAVAFPLALLSIDLLIGRNYNDGIISTSYDWRKWRWSVLIEKLPFLLISIWVGIVTLGALNPTTIINGEVVGFGSRIFFSYVALGQYLGNVLVPLNLSNSYPVPNSFSEVGFLKIIIPAFLIGLYSLLLFKCTDKRHLIFGGLFFITNLIFVLHLLALNTSLAYDRFSYLPYIGIFYMLGYGIYLGYSKLPKYRILFIGAPLVFLVVMGVESSNRILVWRNSESLWTSAINNHPLLPIAFNGRGEYYYKQNQFDKAMLDFNEALRLKPTYPEAHYNQGLVYHDEKKNEQAYNSYSTAILQKEDFAKAYNNRGTINKILGRIEEGLKDYNQAIALDPDFFEAYNNRGNLSSDLGKYDEALADYNLAIQINPYLMASHVNRGRVYAEQGNFELAISDYTFALSNDPDIAEAYYNRSIAYYGLKNYELARDDVLSAQKLGMNVDRDYLQFLINITNKQGNP